MYTVINSNFDVIAEFESYEDALQFVETNADLDLEILEDEEPDYEDSFDEVGYDPYMGCYSWDC